MSDAKASFIEHVQHMQDYLDLALSEADTRVYLIDPVLRILGYVRPGDVRREVPVPATREFLDYELYADGKAQAIVEAKALRHPVTDQAAAQCVQYASVLGVRWCIITNGVAWAIYNAHATGPLADKKVASVRLDGDESAIEETWEVLALFRRDSLAQANPLTRLLTERVILDELTRPDSPAVTALRKAIRLRFGERVGAQAVVDAVNRVRSAAARPTSERATADTDPVTATVVVSVRSAAAHKAWATRRGSTDPSPSNDAPAADATTSSGDPLDRRDRRQRTELLKPDGTRVTIRDLVRAGSLPQDAPLELRMDGVTYLGRVRDEGIEANGQLFSNPSVAAGSLRGGAASNGWRLWTYQGRSLTALREDFLNGLASTTEQTPSAGGG